MRKLLLRLKQRIARKLFNLIQPKYQSLENFLKEELRKELQDQQFALAEQKIEALHKRRQKGASPQPFIFNYNPDTCDHLKGGRFRSLSSYKDYSVMDHTFADGSRKIACLICRTEWTPSSPDWQKAVEMTKSSSNTRSSSEISMETLQRAKEINKWIPSSITTVVQTVSRRLTSRRKGTRKRN